MELVRRPMNRAHRPSFLVLQMQVRGREHVQKVVEWQQEQDFGSLQPVLPPFLASSLTSVFPIVATIFSLLRLNPHQTLHEPPERRRRLVVVVVVGKQHLLG